MEQQTIISKLLMWSCERKDNTALELYSESLQKTLSRSYGELVDSVKKVAFGIRKKMNRGEHVRFGRVPSNIVYAILVLCKCAYTTQFFWVPYFDRMIP